MGYASSSAYNNNLKSMGKIMGNNEQESFIRWQAITREYFTTVSNLVLGLATGLLAFLVSGLFSTQPTIKCITVIGTGSLVFLAGSAGLAVWCAINRLRDFRATAKIARSRRKCEHIDSEARQETKVIGDLSWRLFWWQLVLFAFGATGVSVLIIARLWS